jgi:hypothetical protein
MQVDANALQCYCRGLVPQVLRVAGYDPKNLDTVRLPSAAHDWGVTHPVPGMVPPLPTEVEAPPI